MFTNIQKITEVSSKPINIPGAKARIKKIKEYEKMYAPSVARFDNYMKSKAICPPLKRCYACHDLKGLEYDRKKSK